MVGMQYEFPMMLMAYVCTSTGELIVLACHNIGGGTMGAQAPTSFMLWGQCPHKFSYGL